MAIRLSGRRIDDDETVFSVEATADGLGGHVELGWSMRPGLGMEATWEVSATTWIEAGQQLTTLASDVRAFLARP